LCTRRPLYELVENLPRFVLLSGKRVCASEAFHDLRTAKYGDGYLMRPHRVVITAELLVGITEPVMAERKV